MRFFGRQQPDEHTVPHDIVSKMERFGRQEWDPQGSAMSSGDVADMMVALYPIASAAPDRFLGDLAAAVLPAGGWAVYGASRLIWELLSVSRGSPLSQHPSYVAIMDDAIEFLRSNGVPPMRVRGYEWDYWLDKGGTNLTWLPLLRTPAPGEAPITELRSGETRRIAQLTSQPDSNVILVRQRDDGQYCAIIDDRRSDEDPRRTQWEWKSAGSLPELYVEIGVSTQTPTYWYDKELEPYFPLPRPRI